MISEDLLTWHKKYGRHDLPWQSPRTLYRVWLSEIMLQQTQVSTVVPYFERFITTFPDIKTLASASQDAVLHLWTGLGYYARARNLHKTARIIAADHSGEFPTDYQTVLDLPGIGRSTAGAILAQALGQRHAILDGNVKRVLTRLHGVEGWPGDKKVETILWQLAEKYTPDSQIADYTQAIMDLGATVCKRSRPLCDTCPFTDKCVAYQQQRTHEFPYRKAKKTLPVKRTQMLMLYQQHNCLLEQRPPTGIWGNLWSFPECAADADPADFIHQKFGIKLDMLNRLPTLRHTFSHFHLDIDPVLAQVSANSDSSLGHIMENDRLVWYNTDAPDARGLPAPVVKLLAQHAKHNTIEQETT